MKASARIEHCQKFGFRLASKSPRSAAGTSKFRTGRGDSYMFRDNVLRKLGYRQYADYLKSDVWQKIRARVLKARPTCECCVARQATQVHHLRYDFDTMLGSHTRHLAALCRVCHEEAEFDGDRIKNSLKRANSKLKRNRRKTRKRGPRSL